tara:strand:- start:23 stop:295 length:273 start_codon:yes stop_codon:yes gene_type:complete
MELDVYEVKGEIVFPLYNIVLGFNDSHRDLLRYFNTNAVIERIEDTTELDMFIEVQVDLFNLDLLSEYFNEDTTNIIRNEILTLYKEYYV